MRSSPTSASPTPLAHADGVMSDVEQFSGHLKDSKGARRVRVALLEVQLAEPAPRPAEGRILRHARGQPGPGTAGTQVYLLESPESETLEPNDGVTFQDIAVNDLGNGATTIDVATITYESFNPNPPSTYPSYSITRYLSGVSGQVTI